MFWRLKNEKNNIIKSHNRIFNFTWNWFFNWKVYREYNMRCANTEVLNKYLSGEEQLEKENERYEIEFLEILSNLKIYAMKNDKLELLKDVIKEQFNL